MQTSTHEWSDGTMAALLYPLCNPLQGDNKISTKQSTLKMFVFTLAFDLKTSVHLVPLNVCVSFA